MHTVAVKKSQHLEPDLLRPGVAVLGAGVSRVEKEGGRCRTWLMWTSLWSPSSVDTITYPGSPGPASPVTRPGWRKLILLLQNMHTRLPSTSEAALSGLDRETVDRDRDRENIMMSAFIVPDVEHCPLEQLLRGKYVGLVAYSDTLNLQKYLYSNKVVTRPLSLSTVTP